MKQFEKHTAIRLPWEDVSRLAGAEIAKIIGHEVSCRVSVDAHDYWGIGLCGYRMPIHEICRLIGALDLDNDTARYELPNFEDVETTIRDIGMDMAVTLLKRALPFQWEVSFYDEDVLWLMVDDDPQENSEKLYCRFCFNARIYEPSEDPYETPLTDENDFGSFSVGECNKGYSLMIHTGHGKPQNITARRWSENLRCWLDVGIYEPKYCPECGRRLDEYEQE